MRPILSPLAVLLLLHAAPAARPDATNHATKNARAQQLIHLLNLKVLPKESGYLGIIGKSSQQVTVDGRKLAVQSQNYYMLTRERPINYVHWLAPDDTHILIEGGPVDYYIFHPDGRAEKLTLGMDLAHGERPVIAVPGGCWKALLLHQGAGYALMANALSPEFTPDRVHIGADQAWIDRYKGKAPWATQTFLRSLIGPNESPTPPRAPQSAYPDAPNHKTSSISP